MKKFLALALSVIMLLTFVSCAGGDTNEPAVPNEPDGPTATTTKPAVPEDADITTALWALSYDETVWTLLEEDMVNEEETCSATLQIPNPEDPECYLISVDVIAYIDDPYDFREDLVYYGFDQYEYAEKNSYDYVNIGGVDFLKHEWESWGETTLKYFNRIEHAGATVEVAVNAEDVTDSRVAALLEGLTFTLPDTGNEDGPWEWEGEAFAAANHSAVAGTYTLESEWIELDPYISTFETFNHAVAAVGNTVYLLTAGTLREYTFDGKKLTHKKDIELPEEDFDTITATDDGSLWLSGSMNELTVIKDGAVVAAYEDLDDDVVMHPSGTWGVSYFSGNECQKVTFTGDSYTATDLVFKEVDSIMNLIVGGNKIFVCGSAADDSGHKVFVYDADGALKATLCDEDGEGLGSITYVAESVNGYIGFDGNLRTIDLWSADGSFIGEVEDSDLFETGYPWFCASTMMNDGSILTIMTEEREDRSATELIAFTVKCS